MKKQITATAMVLGLSFSLAAYANDETMPPVDEDMTEETTLMMLPDAASEQGIEQSRYGLDTASHARGQASEFGRARATEARDGGLVGAEKPDRPGRPER